MANTFYFKHGERYGQIVNSVQFDGAKPTGVSAASMVLTYKFTPKTFTRTMARDESPVDKIKLAYEPQASDWAAGAEFLERGEYWIDYYLTVNGKTAIIPMSERDTLVVL